MTPSKEAVALVEASQNAAHLCASIGADESFHDCDDAANALLAHIATLEADAARWRKVAPLIEGMREAMSGVVTPWIESKERRCIDTGASVRILSHHGNSIGARMCQT